MAWDTIIVRKGSIKGGLPKSNWVFETSFKIVFKSNGTFEKYFNSLIEWIAWIGIFGKSNFASHDSWKILLKLNWSIIDDLYFSTNLIEIFLEAVDKLKKFNAPDISLIEGNPKIAGTRL